MNSQHTHSSASASAPQNHGTRPDSQFASAGKEGTSREGGASTSSPSANAWSDADRARAFERFKDALLRGAMVGVGLRGGLNVVSLALHLFRKKGGGVSLELLKSMGVDTSRFGAFVGSFCGVVVAVDEGLSAVIGRERSSSFRAIVAGILAGPTLLLTGGSSPHTSLATYGFVRALTLLIRMANNKPALGWLHTLLAPTRAEHGDVALMCIAVAQILYSFLLRPETLPRSYINFLGKHAGQPSYFYEGMRELVERNRVWDAPAAPLMSFRGVPSKEDLLVKTTCDMLGPDHDCNHHFLHFVRTAWLRALPVYLPIFVIPAIFVHRKNLLQRPLPILWKVAQGVARSSFFLASCIGFAWRGACFAAKLTGTSTWWTIAGSAWVAGLATFFEKKSRRMELSLYAISRAIESFFLCVKDVPVIRLLRSYLPKRMDVLLFSAASAIILHCYSDKKGRHRDKFRSKYRNAFDFLLGNEGHQEGGIRHAPSNRDLRRHLVNKLLGRTSSGGLRASVSLPDVRKAVEESERGLHRINEEEIEDTQGSSVSRTNTMNGGEDVDSSTPTETAESSVHGAAPSAGPLANAPLGPVSGRG